MKIEFKLKKIGNKVALSYRRGRSLAVNFATTIIILPVRDNDICPAIEFRRKR